MGTMVGERMPKLRTEASLGKALRSRSSVLYPLRAAKYAWNVPRMPAPITMRSAWRIGVSMSRLYPRWRELHRPPADDTMLIVSHTRVRDGLKPLALARRHRGLVYYICTGAEGHSAPSFAHSKACISFLVACVYD